LKRTMAKDDVVITAKIGEGTGKATVWTCDFSYEYVKINGEYHT
ncbi:MAG: bifunctional ornithine acetyltransferase/N-acetylglutamate synthase, partial [Selenomonadales bacterium]|nr:bifunctional ornithine acetyltransferase/N-acetylglutamate synthase [Selenomonadales bacterium]